MVAITKRDMVAYKFIQQFKLVSIEQVNRIAYGNYQVCARNLRKLAKDELIAKTRNKHDKGILYTVDGRRSTKQYYHYMLRNELYLKLVELSDSVERVDIEPTFGSIQADMLIIGVYKGERYFFLVECETIVNIKPINIDKYSHFFIKEWREYFDVEPTVLYVTEKKVDKGRVKFHHQVCDLELNGLEEVLKGARKF